MFVREQQQRPREMYYADSLLTLPTTTHSAYANLVGGLASSMAVIEDVEQLFSEKPQGHPLRDLAESVQIMNQTPGMGWGQRAANELSNMVGYGLNPLVWGFGRLGGAAVETALGIGGKVLPDAANVFLRKPLSEVIGEPLGKYVPKVKVAGEKVPLTSELLGKKYAESFGTFAGAGVPQAWYENYNADTRHIDWGGGARDLGVMGAFGLAVQSVPFAWGVLKAKVTRSIGKAPEEALTMADYSKAFEDGFISKEEFEWIKDYTEKPLDTPNLKERASKILSGNDIDVNAATHETPVTILKDTDIENLKSALLDQSLSDLSPEVKTSLSDYITHNSIDRIREQPQILDGLRGYRDHINKKLEKKYPKLAEADKMLDEHLTKSVKENMPFSQKELFKIMRQFGFESSHIKNLPVTIPENLSGMLKRMEEIARIEEKNKFYEKKISQGKKGFNGRLSGNLKRIEQLREKLPKILTPKEELEYLRKGLLTEKGLPKGWERSRAYHRLVDLSHVWHNAKTLLDRVHLEAAYEKQEAFKNLADTVLKMTDSNIGRFANRGNVVSYMQDRIKSKTLRQEPNKLIEKKVDHQIKVPSNADELLNINEIEINKIGAENLSKEFNEMAVKFKEFKSTENVFKNLIQCVLGGIGG